MATKQTLSPSTWLVGETFTVKIHRQPTVDLPYGRGTNSQVSYACNADISSAIELRHPECDNASATVLGIEILKTEAIKEYYAIDNEA